MTTEMLSPIGKLLQEKEELHEFLTKLVELYKRLDIELSRHSPKEAWQEAEQQRAMECCHYHRRRANAVHAEIVRIRATINRGKAQ